MTEKKKSTNQRVQNRDVNAAQRASLAVKLRTQKVKYDEIARLCGYGSAGAAHKAVMRELNRTVVSNVEELRTEEIESLERLEFECWKIFNDKERSRSQLFAVDRILQIKERRAKLMGLDVQNSANVVAANVVVRELPAGYFGADVTAVDATKEHNA